MARLFKATPGLKGAAALKLVKSVMSSEPDQQKIDKLTRINSRIESYKQGSRQVHPGAGCKQRNLKALLPVHRPNPDEMKELSELTDRQEGYEDLAPAERDEAFVAKLLEAKRDARQGKRVPLSRLGI